MTKPTSTIKRAAGRPAETNGRLVAGGKLPQNRSDLSVCESASPRAPHPALAICLESAVLKIKEVQKKVRENGFSERPTWPAIVARTPKGWTGPKVVDGVPVEGAFRSHQVPLANVRENPEHLRLLEEWLLSYRPGELFDEEGRVLPEIAALAPQGDRRMGSNPHANGGKLSIPLDLP
jgi:xylulose-5-phosphate/fructose-6-phosphate phosphoketolase